MLCVFSTRYIKVSVCRIWVSKLIHSCLVCRYLQYDIGAVLENLFFFGRFSELFLLNDLKLVFSYNYFTQHSLQYIM